MPPSTAPTLAAPPTHYENFPVASWLCPPRLRPPIAAIYHFARTADDIADEGDAGPTPRLADLRDFRAELAVAARGTVDPASRWPDVFGPLAHAMRTFALPEALLADLLDAFAQDIAHTRDRRWYADRAGLLDYCRRSANPIGRLLLHLYGVDDAPSLERSDAICSALQLINFWQDLGEDIGRGRIYLPADSWAAHGVDEAQLMGLDSNPNTLKLIAFHVQLASAMMLKGAQLVKKVPGRGGWELRLVVQGGLRILDKIEALGFDTLRRRPKLGAWDVLVMGWRALKM